MEIERYELIKWDALVGYLREVPLKGYGGVKVYQDAKITLESGDPSNLVPPQAYVVKGRMDDIGALADYFMREHGIDIFALEGGLLFWPKGSNPEKDRPIPFLPPIVEISTGENGEEGLHLINDGMHRTSTARRRGRERINYILIDGVSLEYPYYAYQFPGGWDGVAEVVEVTRELKEQKRYRKPGKEYKELFRLFDTIFPGIQEERVPVK